MAMYVYRDVKRTIELYAQDAVKGDMGTRYYCPNSNCDAHMYLCGVDGLSTVYFSANRNAHPHIDGCDFGSSNGFHPNNTDESAFDFQTILENMMNPSSPTKKKKSPNSHKTGVSHLKPLRTIRQVYDMCKSYPCTRSYNNQLIGQMLLDDRSAYMYPKGVFGNRIVETKVKVGTFYNPNKKEIYLVGPSSQEYEFILQVSDDKLFGFIRDSLFNNRDRFVIVAGHWESSATFNVFKTNVTSKRQIKIIT